MNASIFESDSFTHILPVLKRLQEQKALSHDLINVNQYPNSKIINEMIEKLFFALKDQNINLVILTELLNSTNVMDSCRNLNQKLSEIQVMKFSQLVLYKVLPCPNGENCEYLPREIATNNQYYDKELACPFYHHYRDQRRLCINDKLEEEFFYQANYFDEEKQTTNKDSYSQNYFESMFHPLYYKMFQCTRKYCKAAPYCPFYHAEEEKCIWGDYFSQYINKERVSYVKEKKKGSPMTSTDVSVNSVNSLSPKSESDKVRSPPSDYFRSPKYDNRNMYQQYDNQSYEIYERRYVYGNERYDETTTQSFSKFSPKNKSNDGFVRRITKQIRVA